MPAATLTVPVPVYGAVPPFAVMFTTAFPPLHNIEVLTDELATNWVGCATLIVVVLVHPFASVTV